MAFSLIEPHPSVPKTKKKTNLSTGRGGAGNISSYDSSDLTSGPSATGPASRFSTSTTSGKQPIDTTTYPTDPRPSSASKKSKSSFSSSPKAYSGGIGGAGNFHSASDRRMFSFDEELERAQRIEDAKSGVPVYHFGRGGAGNLASAVTDKRASGSSKSSKSGRAGSTASNGTDSSVESRGRGLGSWLRGLSTSRE